MKVEYPAHKLTDDERAELIEIAISGVPNCVSSGSSGCKQYSHDGRYVCTRSAGHAGWHAAHGLHSVTPIRVWLDSSVVFRYGR